MDKFDDIRAIGDLYAPPKITTIVEPTRMPVILASLGVLVFLLTILPSFMHCYNERSQKFERNREFLVESGLCDRFLHDTLVKHGYADKAKILSNIYVEKARYHEIETNCEQSYLFIQQSKLFGAMDDWFTSSTLYSILTGGNWKIQVVIAVLAIITVRFFLNYLVRNNAVNQAFGAIKSDNYAVVLDQ